MSVEFLVAMTDNTKRGGSGKSSNKYGKSINSDSPLPEGSSDNGSVNGVKSPHRLRSQEEGPSSPALPPMLEIKIPPRVEDPGTVVGGAGGSNTHAASHKKTPTAPPPTSVKRSSKEKVSHGSVYVEDHEGLEPLPGAGTAYTPGGDSDQYPGTATSQLINHAHNNYGHSIKRMKSSEKNAVGHAPAGGVDAHVGNNHPGTNSYHEIPILAAGGKSASVADISHGNEVEFGNFDHHQEPAIPLKGIKEIREIPLTPKKAPNKVKLQSLNNNPSNDLVGGFTADGTNQSPRENKEGSYRERIAIYNGSTEPFYGRSQDAVSSQESDDHLAAAETVGK